MGDLSLADFSGAIGQPYEIEAEGQRHRMDLIAAEELGPSGREAGSFRLEFRGPFEPILPQAIYGFRRDGETREIFVTPVGREAEGTRYEAIFF
ncbi:DUF6916 family protein [Allosphingosinicella sp.]|jgi:hypothetical protein|uniref:DUF6916 family protein n=1 Tax=Allosphingosinicella sp. TaxID=2823234 RepID=UPI002EFBE9F1